VTHSSPSGIAHCSDKVPECCGILFAFPGCPVYIQGGSDISGTLSKLHFHIKKIFV
jgi:hypothetical protein